MAKAKSPIPEGFHTVTPQLVLDNAAEAIDWYKKGLGAEELGRAVGPDGKIMHAELRIGKAPGQRRAASASFGPSRLCQPALIVGHTLA